MKEFKSSLLREKFLIFDPSLKASSYEPVKAMSNRLDIELKDGSGKTVENYVLRAHNMHSCVRMGARIIQAFIGGGALSERAQPYEWDTAWDAIINSYERSYNDERWICVYHEGRAIFEEGVRHPLLDVIEKCYFGSGRDYDYAISESEKAFRATGKIVNIEQDSNVALAIHCEEKQARFGVILRAPNRTTTFNFTATSAKDDINIPQCLSAAAALLEGVQLAFMVGINTEKIRLGIIARLSKDDKQTREAGQRLGRLNAELASLEEVYDVRYRPEKPEFRALMADAEALAQRTLEPPAHTSDDEERSEAHQLMEVDDGDKTEDITSRTSSGPLAPRSKSAKNPWDD